MTSSAPAGNGMARRLESMVEDLIEDHREAIIDHLHAAGGLAALEAADNEAAMTALARRLHALLPGMARMMLSEDAVIGFVLRNRMAVLAKVTPLLADGRAL